MATGVCEMGLTAKRIKDGLDALATGDPRVAEHVLDGSEIHSVLERVSCKRVP